MPMNVDYKYLAEVWPGETTDAPSGLWRTRGGETEYLSLIDWEWHPVTDEISEPAPGTLVEITAEAAQELLSDRQRFVRYWSYQHPNSGGSPKENRVYRRRASPERVVDEVFGPTNAWTPTGLITEFTVGNPADKPDMIAIDREATEQLIQQTRGITGATDLAGTRRLETVRFVVGEKWDLPSRDGVLVFGELQAGVIQRGSTLWAVGWSVRVLGVEFPTPKGGEALLIDRRKGAWIKPGMVLTDSAPPGFSAQSTDS